MRRKGGILLAIIVTILLLIGIALYQVVANLDSLVARMIEEQGSEAAGTAVTVGSVAIDLAGGSGSVSGLEVANPPAFSDRPAIRFEEIRIRLAPMAVTRSPIVIDQVSVSGASVLMEQTAAGNNLGTIQEALRQPGAKEPDTSGPAVVIDHFVLEDANLRIDVPQLDQSRTARIGGIEVSDIGRASNGATAKAVARQILAPVVRAALESAAAEGVRNQVQRELDEAKEEIAEKLLENPSQDRQR